MTATAAAIFKIPTESPQLASPRPARGKGARPAARAKAGRPAPTRSLANGTGRAATRHLGATWTWRDEWYAFRSDPRGAVEVLLSVDESTYRGGTMGEGHPIAWCRESGGGRSFYTALGHTAEGFGEPAFRQHLGGAVNWLVGG